MARPDFPRSLAEFQSRFASEEDCRRYLMACRWPDGFRCPRCGKREACELATRELLQCRSCRHQASVTAGKWDEAKATVGTLQTACGRCHGQYRERFDDGSFRYKSGSR